MRIKFAKCCVIALLVLMGSGITGCKLFHRPPNVKPEDVATLQNQFCDYYAQSMNVENSPYPEAQEAYTAIAEVTKDTCMKELDEYGKKNGPGAEYELIVDATRRCSDKQGGVTWNNCVYDIVQPKGVGVPKRGY